MASFAFSAYPSPIAVTRRRVLHIGTCSMSRGRENPALWISRLDQLVAARLDRRVLIQTTSYDRLNRYLGASRWAKEGVLMSHGKGDLEKAVGQYLNRQPPVVLLSPAAVRGLDCPGEACRCLIVLKVPWPDTRSPIYQARKELNSEYPAEQTMQTLEQEFGRGVRHELDWCENLCTDDFLPQFMRAYRHLATASFLEAWDAGGTWRGVGLPPPPPLDWDGVGAYGGLRQ